MPCKNEYVNYGTQGICKVDDIRLLKFGVGGDRRNYYILRPVHQENASVFVPADNRELVGRMRPVLSPEEIDRVILSVRGEKMPWISDRKQRSARLQDILSRRDERELLLLAGCLYARSRESGKGLSASDAQALKKAETIIEQEFSFSLNLSAQEIGAYIRGKLERSSTAGA